MRGDGAKIRQLRDYLGWTQGELAAALTEVLRGKPVAQSLISNWEGSEEIDRYVLAAVAFVHPTPAACLEWFTGKREGIPGIPVDLPATGSHSPQVAPVPETPLHLRKRQRKNRPA